MVGFERREPVFGCVSSAGSPVCVVAPGSSDVWVPNPHQLHSTYAVACPAATLDQIQLVL